LIYELSIEERVISNETELLVFYFYFRLCWFLFCSTFCDKHSNRIVRIQQYF